MILKIVHFSSLGLKRCSSPADPHDFKLVRHATERVSPKLNWAQSSLCKQGLNT